MQIMQILKGESQAEAIFVSDYGYAETVKDIERVFFEERSSDIYTLSPLFTIPENDFLKYELNYQFLGHSAAKQIVKMIEGPAIHEKITLGNEGFRFWHRKNDS